MHRENLTRLLDYMKSEKGRKHFDMATYFYAPGVYTDWKTLTEADNICGTVHCLAGSAAMLAEPNRRYVMADSSLQEVAREWLGLEEADAKELFHARSVSKPIEDISPAEAIATLEQILETGEVKWLVDEEFFWSEDD